LGKRGNNKSIAEELLSSGVKGTKKLKEKGSSKNQTNLGKRDRRHNYISSIITAVEEKPRWRKATSRESWSRTLTGRERAIFSSIITAWRERGPNTAGKNLSEKLQENQLKDTGTFRR